MTDSARDKKLVYHLQSLRNLASSVASGLLSRRDLGLARISFADHADPEILLGRAEHGLDAYVPFHFIPKNPFDYAAIRRAPNEQFVLIAVERRVASAGRWKISPKHPLSDGEPPLVLDWIPGLEAIDWSQMDKHPRPWETDRECRLACMAEALSPVSVPATAWRAVYVATRETEQAVRAILRQAGVSPYLNFAPNMLPPGAR
jgi:hypothetical protein